MAAESGQEQRPGGRRIAVDNPYEAAKATLLQTVAHANRCQVVWSKAVGLVTVIGFPADLDAVELLFTSLLVQANTAMLRAGGKQDAGGRSRTRAFRTSFLVSYAARIGERLSEAAGQAEREAEAEQRAAAGAGRRGTDLVPFLAAREQAVDATVAEMFAAGLTRSRGPGHRRRGLGVRARRGRPGQPAQPRPSRPLAARPPGPAAPARPSVRSRPGRRRGRRRPARCPR
jgi:hypothetical protein